MSKVDLHIHTTASDGKFSPEDIVRKSWEIGLSYIGITDHDSINGVLPAQEAARNFPGITVISGVEINTDIPSGELHVLGYLFDPQSTELQTELERLRHSRVERAKKMIHKLGMLGIYIEFDRVKELAGTGSIGRPHVAQAMLEKSYVNSFKEAFNKYISRGCPAYVERDKITPVEATQLVVRAKGIPVMAHPFTFDNTEKLIVECKAAGLLGLEVYYGSYSPDQVQELLNLAVKYDLIPTGGSDFHGLDNFVEPSLGVVDVPLESAERLIALKENMQNRNP